MPQEVIPRPEPQSVTALLLFGWRAPTKPSPNAALSPSLQPHPRAGAILSPVPTSLRPSSPERYTPKHLAEKILTSKATLEGERRQVTVLFADLKG
jgi:hypothetical protein